MLRHSTMARGRWTDGFGPPRLKDSFELPDRSWAWNDDWSLDNGADSDAEG